MAATCSDRLLAVGGGSKSHYWLEAIATALGVPVDLPVAGDFGGAFGAARLAMMAATGGGAEIATAPRIQATIDPISDLTAGYDDGFARFKTAQHALKRLT